MPRPKKATTEKKKTKKELWQEEQAKLVKEINALELRTEKGEEIQDFLLLHHKLGGDTEKFLDEFECWMHYLFGGKSY